MNLVYLLQHIYESDNGYEESKVLGIFSSEIEAKKAVLLYKDLPGFKDRPADFYIDPYEINRKYWPQGFERL